MLKKLRIEFIAITLILVGVVLAITLGMSYYSTYTAQYDITMDSLERGLSSESGTGISGHGAPDGDNGHGFMGTFTLTVTASSSGVILGKSDSPISISVDDLATIVTEAVTSSEDSGTNSEYHLAWLKKTTSTGYVISIADTSSRDSALNHQLVMSIGIFAAAMAALFVIVWFLSSWALEPVKDAWERQRRFISDASHELKTPLAVIIANVQILQKDHGIPDQSMHWIDSTADEADHMKSLVEELLVLARTDEATSGTAQSALIREDLDLSELVEESVL
ncbi:MAG: histidine kinase dimerization/phospho-acceptor domain-containing protein, partial [Olsenella sp.]